ncbi:hydroxyacid dehydrogenase [Roseomonas hellenica]|uniref:Hydroxyacid dehydrogenase n=1 Tax=Plastoroseomonas hellenica TaxID=2687306 RepID=A0ABS5F846_9PROT|nr:hydroxyacid dehydrogenase [Plastoroseomonas hellenica]MBR0668701.1 hydroxyacid dehydrogenase [Plastoroseomonas hellenica]
MTKILITGPALSAEGTAEAARLGLTLVTSKPYLPPAETAAIAAELRPDAIIVRQGAVTAEVMDAAPTLRVIVKHGVGYDNIEVAAATARGIPVMLARGANSQSVAELAFGLMFTVARQTAHLTARMRAGQWDKATHTGTELFGRTLGIVGLGDIGGILAGLVAPLRMPVRIFDPFLPEGAALPEGAEQVQSLDALLAVSDILSLHCPLSPATHHMIGAPQLAAMRRGSFLINTARGGLADADALAVALQDGPIAGAALDVFEPEPPVFTHPIFALPNLVATPHAGASTQAAKDRSGVLALRHICDVIEGRAPDARAIVNRDVLAAR